MKNRAAFFDFLKSMNVIYSVDEETLLWEKLTFFSEILLEKNQHLNLTGIKDPEGVLWKHFADSLVLAKLEPMGVLCDWGSGGGFPGIPLALHRLVKRSSTPVILVDSVRKKTEATKQFAEQLNLSSCSSVWSRGEVFLKTDAGKIVETIVLRAVAPLKEMQGWISSSDKSWIFLLGPKQLPDLDKFTIFMNRKKYVRKGFLQFSLPDGSGERGIIKFVPKKK